MFQTSVLFARESQTNIATIFTANVAFYSLANRKRISRKFLYYFIDECSVIYTAAIMFVEFSRECSTLFVCWSLAIFFCANVARYSRTMCLSGLHFCIRKNFITYIYLIASGTDLKKNNVIQMQGVIPVARILANYTMTGSVLSIPLNSYGLVEVFLCKSSR